MAHRPARGLRNVLLALAAFALGTAGFVLISGQAAVVITHGVSMNPVYYQGDLVVVAKESSYGLGDIAAYKIPGKDEVALHRIIGGDPAAYVFKGDNNESVDPTRPGAAQLVGRAVFHLPQGGRWLEALTSPASLGLLAFVLLATGGARARRRRHRRRTVSRHISTRPARTTKLWPLPPALRVSAVLAAVLAGIGIVLAVPAWAGPVEEASTSTVKSGTRMDFSYTAAVGQSAAYDGTTAHSPDPVFRKLADSVDARFTYHGDPGTISVTAELSTAGGWHSSIPLGEPATFAGTDYTHDVRLDLKAYEAKAQAASTVTGLPATPVTLTLKPAVTTTTGAQFRPELKLTLTPLQLSLAGGPEALSVNDTKSRQQTTLVPRTLSAAGLTVAAGTARVVATVLILAALAIALIITGFAHRSVPVDEAAAIRRRYASQLVKVHPMPAPQGRPVIDVTTFPTLAKLAERYGLLILHWNRSGVETFIVQDENITYRYRPSTPDARPATTDMAGSHS
ncbi:MULTISPECIES: DUF5305 family protein [unclassified Arthrobacter]|uniref:DUF5305 family protein n=1 Tax=unclassified Arthrobacter TaxID=235627 RepID=UPI001C85B16C|nr:DUF5305 family protein [Arthrobacter sp. MAHUQ-56]MBX7443359.1 hypothetical protein [Arthrobacter sp. MAHUQ-56]